MKELEMNVTRDDCFLYVELAPEIMGSGTRIKVPASFAVKYRKLWDEMSNMQNEIRRYVEKAIDEKTKDL